MERYYFAILAAGIALAAFAWIYLLVIAFRVHRAWGIGLLLIPPLALIFIPLHWKRAAPVISLLLVAAIVGFTPLVWSQIEQRYYRFGPREKMVDDELHITLTGWNQDDYSRLARRPEVVVLQMANEDVTDETIEYLRNMTELRELDLDNTKITANGLAILATLPKLQSLHLRNTAISDEDFTTHLADKESLLEIDLIGTKVASKTLRKWKSAKEGRKYLK
jgi:hypothetical protein